MHAEKLRTWIARRCHRKDHACRVRISAPESRVIDSNQFAGDVGPSGDCEIVPAHRNPILVETQHGKVGPLTVSVTAVSSSATADRVPGQRPTALKVRRGQI